MGSRAGREKIKICSLCRESNHYPLVAENLAYVLNLIKRPLLVLIETECLVKRVLALSVTSSVLKGQF